MVSGQTGKHTQENRILRFWFRPHPQKNEEVSGDNQASIAQDFFKELVSPKEFPRGLLNNMFICYDLTVVS